MKNLQIAISIVTYNGDDVFKTLANLQQEILPFFPCRIYLYDNHSTSAFQKKLAEYQSEQITIHYGAENRGFGHGHNYNARQATEELFLICNPDILVSQKSFQRMLRYLEKEPQRMVAPKVLNTDGSTQFLVRRRLAVFDYFLRFLPGNFLKKIFQRRLAYFECRDLTDEVQEIAFASGCFMFTSRAAFLAVEGFDEGFFMYFEDNDLCQKYRQVQQKIIYLPQAEVTHFYAKGAHRNPKLFKIFLQSMMRYFNKWGWQFF